MLNSKTPPHDCLSYNYKCPVCVFIKDNSVCPRDSKERQMSTFKEQKLEEFDKLFGIVVVEYRLRDALKSFISQTIDQTVEEVRKDTINKLKDLLEKHCCSYGCSCEKEHLYCGYELEHGIELESVISNLSSSGLIKNK